MGRSAGAKAGRIKQTGQAPAAGATPELLALRAALAAGLRSLGVFALGDHQVETGEGADSLWLIVRRPGRGGLALRAAYAPGGFSAVRRLRRRAGETLSLEAQSLLGRHRITVRAGGADLHRLVLTATLTPEAPLALPFLPRDLYVLDAADDPFGAEGQVEAAQRGPNTGLVYLTLRTPDFGAALYVQDLTALNGYCRATGTTPTGVVGGRWPELGLLAPTRRQDGGEAAALPAGEEVVLSRVVLVLRDLGPDGEAERARQFVQMMGEAYGVLERPEVVYRDWVDRAERTLRDLERAPEAAVQAYGRRYVRPYTAAEVPDSMVQMTVLAALRDYGAWRGAPLPLEAELAAGMERFYDPELKTLRRYLPNVGPEKNKDAVDAWYLYHPLRNLARIALDGQDWARDLFLRCVDYGVRAAQHFRYVFPIMYDVRDFSVITPTRGDETHGQTDVGGFYAYVMLQAFELTGEQRFIDESRAAIDAAVGSRFELEYQANLTAWGATACLRLWRITGEDRYREQAYAYLASLLHNTALWESELSAAEHYSTFFGATALHDAAYMAMYECFDSFAAMERFLRESGPELDPAARMLVGEYCKYALHRAWFFYPDALPEEALADQSRNGHVDRALSFPAEDLYPDGRPAGQVGQEVYGAGAAFVFASRAVLRPPDAPFQIFCNAFVVAQDRTGSRALSLQLVGGEDCAALLVVTPAGDAPLPKVKATLAGGDRLRPRRSTADRIEFTVPAAARVLLTWEDQS